jgi:hypothetical protein
MIDSMKEDEPKRAERQRSLHFQIYSNQVGGHSCLLKPYQSADFIIKPFNEQEFVFYESLSKEGAMKLLDFVPKYYGMMSIDEEKYPEIKLTDVPKKEDLSNTPKAKLKHSVSMPDGREEVKEDHSVNSYQLLKDFEDSENSKNKNKWFRKLYLERFKKNNTKFLKLQDLTINLNKPCVLDLKMGSIPYDKNKSPSQITKIVNSSSATLCYRICGLFVNQTKTNREEFRDKYWGRKIPNDCIPNALAFFFFDGERLRTNLIDVFLTKLSNLFNVIIECKGYRFNSASLLFVYDGEINDDQLTVTEYEYSDDAPVTKCDKVVLKLIDFAKSEIDPENDAPDLDLLQGIENLRSALKKIRADPQIELYY